MFLTSQLTLCCFHIPSSPSYGRGQWAKNERNCFTPGASVCLFWSLSWKVEPGITICLQAPWWAGHLDLWASFQLLSSKILLLGWFLRKSAKHVVSMKLKTYSHQPILVDSLCARIHKLQKIHILYYSWDHLLSMCSSDQIYPHTRNNYKNQTRHKSGFKDSERQTIKHRDP